MAVEDDAPTINTLKAKRAGYKGKITLHVRLLQPLITAKGAEAKNKADRVKDLSEKFYCVVEKFKEVHAKVAERLESEAEGEAAIEEAIQESGDYCNEVEATIYETIEGLKTFKKEVKAYIEAQLMLSTTIPKSKTDYEDAVRKYCLERDNSLAVLSGLTQLNEEQLGNSQKVRFMNASTPRHKLENAHKNLVEKYTLLHNILRQADLEEIDSEIEKVTPEFEIAEANKEYGELLALMDTCLQIQESFRRSEETTREVELQKARIPPPPPAPRAQGDGNPGEMIKLSKAPNITFSGEARDFTTFKRDFEKIVVPGRPDHDTGYRLKQAIPTKHRHLLDNFDLSDHKGMMDKLQSQFGTKRLVVMNVVGELEKTKKPENDSAFVAFVEKIEKMERDLEAINQRDQLANEAVLTKIEDRIPDLIQDKWADIVIEGNLESAASSEKFTRLMKFLEFCKNKAEYHISKSEASGSKSKSCFVTGTSLAAVVQEVQTPGSATQSKPGSRRNEAQLLPCLACGKDGDVSEAVRHWTGTCQVFSALPLEEKLKLVQCIKCPYSNKDNHKTADCRKSRLAACRHCHAKDSHSSLFCNMREKKDIAATSSLSSKSSSNVLLKSMIVSSRSGGKELNVLEDNCSTDNYISYSAVKKLKLKPLCDVILQIEGINCVKKLDSSLYMVPVTKLDGHLEYVECYGLEKITENNTPLDPNKYANICSELGISPGEVRRPEKIDMLLSTKSSHLMSDEVLRESNGLKLFAGPLGRTIAGNAKTFFKEHTASYPSQAVPVIKSSVNKVISERLTDKGILNFFKEESIGSECHPKCGNCECGKCALGNRQMSLKEEKMYQKFKDNMFLDVKGTSDDPGPYWRTKYPWTIPKTDLKDNREAVHGVMLSTIKKLNKDPSWRDIYEGQLKELVDRKFAREISNKELEDWKLKGKKSYWIAHQMALNPASKSSPIRTVFNSSQIYKGHSLNSSWELGPDMTGDLCGILMRFREDLVGAQGDVAKMYYNVRVTEEEQFMQLFMWRFKGEEEIRIFAMTRLVMGNKPSANSSQIALRETAFIENNHEKFPVAARALTRESYVDNTFTTAPSHEQIKENIDSIETVAKAGGFMYKPWVVSGTDVPDQLLVNGEAEDERALGIHWNVKEDLFYVKVNISGKKRTVNICLSQILSEPCMNLTLRDCLSIHSKAFDPLGLVLPTKMIGMLLFRETIQFLKQNQEGNSNKLPWDKAIDGVLKDRWLEYFSMLDALKDVTFKRSIKPESADPEVPPDLVTFSDGNEQSYGCVSYVLWTLQGGLKEARLIMAKSKLAPLLAKGEVVKNELSGATFAVRMKSWILQNTNLEYRDFVPFLDSRIVQDMIKKESYLLNTFAGLRVKEISAKSDVDTWNHVSSKDNWVADILTRGASPDKIGQDSDWQKGPSWLVEPRDTWPVTEVQLNESDRELIKSYERVSKSFKAKVVKSQERNIFDDLIEHSESLDKIVNFSQR